MYQETLEGLGLSPNEAKIYETLVTHGELGVSEIATRSQIHRRNAYDAIRRLIDKGLCFEIFSKKENLYNAVDPGKLLELTEEKRKSIEAILPELNRKFLRRTATEEAFIYRGYEGQKNIWRDVLRVGKDSYFIGGKGSWIDPKLESSRNAFFNEANRKKIKFHQLFDQSVKKNKLVYGVLTNYPADAYENRGLAKAMLQQYEDAIKDYSKAIQLNPNSNSAYYNRGHLYLQLNNIKQACSDWEMALKLDNAEAKTMLEQYCQ